MTGYASTNTGLECPACGRTVRANSVICVACTQPLKPIRARGGGGGIGLLLPAAVVVLLLAIVVAFIIGGLAAPPA